MNTPFKYIYGPVESWRMGKSLGIDPLSDKSKICNLDCIYCQLGKTHIFSNERKVFVATDDVVDEIEQFFHCPPSGDPTIAQNIDYLTFSGRGEPTLAKNLGEMIKGIQKIRKEEIAVITNSTLLHLKEVQEDLCLSDLVIAKLDACNEVSFWEVDKAMQGILFEEIIYGIMKFKSQFKGKLALQIMFVENNRKYAQEIAGMARMINADEIQINTPLRPSAATPLDEEGIKEIKSFFRGMPAVTVYDHQRKEMVPVNDQDTMKRHGNFKI